MKLLTDTGSLVALMDATELRHYDCVGVVRDAPEESLVTVWPCFTEAMYFLGHRTGYSGQRLLWEMVADGDLTLGALVEEDLPAMARLMERYQDRPMDPADAALMTFAERVRHRKIFTLDGDFRFYRLSDGSVLEVVP